jgi:hypothetical protein
MMQNLSVWASVAINSLIAVFGTGIIEFPLARILHSHSGGEVILREWIASLILAGPLGFLMQRSWKTGAAKWSWIIPTIFFFFGILIHIAMGRSVSRFSGYDCAVRLNRLSCRDFFLFTVPLARGVAYSFGAILGAPNPS